MTRNRRTLLVVLAIEVAAALLVLPLVLAPLAPAADKPTGSPGPEAVLVGAGDIASCGSDGDEATASLIDDIPGTVITMGDTAYESGTAEEFARCYDPTWGRFVDRTRPAIGNHEYFTGDAAGYRDYFGAAAGPPGRFYYSYDAGSWHVIVLNSNCRIVGCSPESRQALWLRDDLRSHPAACTAAYWHHPRFTGRGGSSRGREMAGIWAMLQEAGADVVLSGDDHYYERFAPQDAAGRRDDATGIRQFVVGTGGRATDASGEPPATSELRIGGVNGVIKLTLRSGRYAWQFIPVAGETASDAGEDECH